MNRPRVYILTLLAATAALGGCGGVGPDTSPIPTAAIVVVEAVEAAEKKPLEVEATAICGGVRGTITLAEGSVVLRDVPFGTGTPPAQPLTVTAPGYVTLAEPIQISVTMVTFFTAELQPADPELTGTVTGTVRDSDGGAPIASALVKFVHTGVTGSSEVRAYTDKQGTFVVGGIAIGNNAVSVEAPDYVTQTSTMNVVQDAGGGQNPPLDIRLLSGSTTVDVAGTVTDAFTQRRLAGVRVTLGSLPATQTDGSGEFAFSNASVGAQPFAATLTGYDPYTAEIEVLPGMARLRIAMTPSAPEPPPTPHNLEGTVQLNGRPDSSGATVTATSLVSGQDVALVNTPASGAYSMLLPPGQYRLTVAFEGHSVRRTVTVPGGGRVLTGINFVLTVS